MEILHYLKFKYLINVKEEGKYNFLKNVMATCLILIIFTSIIYASLGVLPTSITKNIHTYIVSFYLLLSVFATSTAMKKFHKEYFSSIEREILLIAPISHLKVIYTRAIIVGVEVCTSYFYLLTPFLLASYFKELINTEVLFINVYQVIITCIFVIAYTQILYSVTFFILRKEYFSENISFILTALSYATVVGLIVYSSSIYGSVQILSPISWLFYPIFRYFQFVYELSYTSSDIMIYVLISSIYISFIFACSVLLIRSAFNKGFLVVTSRDSTSRGVKEKYLQGIKKHLRNEWLKKDFLALFRNPSLFKGLLSISIFLIVMESKYNYLSNFYSRTLLISIGTFMFLCVFTSLVFQDDYKAQNFIQYLPFDLTEIYRSKFVLTFVCNSLFSTTFFILLYVSNGNALFGIWHIVAEVLTISYLGAKVYVYLVLKQNMKYSHLYTFNNRYTKSVLKFFFTWNIFICIVTAVIGMILLDTFTTIELNKKIILIFLLLGTCLVFLKIQNKKIQNFLGGYSYGDSKQ